MRSLLLCLCLLSPSLFAQDLSGFNLAPGEVLISVDGVPAAQYFAQLSSQRMQSAQPYQFSCPNGDCSATQPMQNYSVPSMGCPEGGCGAVQMQAYPQRQTVLRQGNSYYRGFPCEIGQGTPQYAHALREAQILAANYQRYPNFYGGHPLGNAPGTQYSGTGYTWDMNRPGHCWEDELPASRIVARARAQAANGAWFWSAHYR